MPPSASLYAVRVRIPEHTQYNKTKSTSRYYVDWETFTILFVVVAVFFFLSSFVFVAFGSNIQLRHTSFDVSFHSILLFFSPLHSLSVHFLFCSGSCCLSIFTHITPNITNLENEMNNWKKNKEDERKRNEIRTHQRAEHRREIYIVIFMHSERRCEKGKWIKCICEAVFFFFFHSFLTLTILYLCGVLANELRPHNTGNNNKSTRSSDSREVKKDGDKLSTAGRKL